MDEDVEALEDVTAVDFFDVVVPSGSVVCILVVDVAVVSAVVPVVKIACSGIVVSVDEIANVVGTILVSVGVVSLTVVAV